MATHKTLEAAEKLAETLRAKYPSATIAVKDVSADMTYNRGGALAQGLTILSEVDEYNVMVRVIKFLVYEIRQCKNGHTYETIAFGEDHECPECSKNAKSPFVAHPAQQFESQWELMDGGE